MLAQNVRSRVLNRDRIRQRAQRVAELQQERLPLLALEQGSLSEFAFRDVERDADHTLDPALWIELRFGPLLEPDDATVDRPPDAKLRVVRTAVGSNLPDLG